MPLEDLSTSVIQKNLHIQEILIFSWVIVIPPYEFVFYPLLNKCLAELVSCTKSVLGLLLLVASIVAVMILLVVVRHNNLEHNVSNHHCNAMIQCIFHDDSSALSLGLDYQWMAIPKTLCSLSFMIFSISAL